MIDRSSIQTVVRAAALGFVVAWLFVDELGSWIPFWLPFAVLLATEAEFLLRGRREPARPERRRTPPGPEDADLGFDELVEDDDGIRYVLPPPRPMRSRGRKALWAAGTVAAAALFVVAARSDRAETWQALPDQERSRSVARFASEAAIVAERPVTLRCDEGYAFTGAGSDRLGIAFPRAGIAFLAPSICRALHDLAFGGERNDRGAEALVVLAHEAIHLGGERREDVTECLALQAAVPLAVRLGIDESRAHDLIRKQFERRLAERSAIRAAYALPTSCRDGEALDRNPRDTRFP